MKNKKNLKRQADKLFSELVRIEGLCEHCGRKPPEVRLNTAHVFSRRFLVTRWEPLNGVCLCVSCHRWAHDRPIEFPEFMKELLGEPVYDELRYIAKTSIKRVDLNEKIKELEWMIE